MRRSLLLVALAAAPAAAQQPVVERLRAAPPVVVQAVDSLLAVAAAHGLPGEPLIQKAIEGTAKGAPSDRVIRALGALLARLNTAAAALRAGGFKTVPEAAIEAGAFALAAGLDSTAVTTLARASARAQAADVTLRVAGTLAAIGVPAAQVLELVTQALRSGDPPGGLLSLPGRVQAAMAHGATPAAAAAGVSRGTPGRGRGVDAPQRGPPPGKGSAPKP